jgi:hypothetical protein
LLNARLKNQKLLSSRVRTPEDVVAWLGAVQAQDYTGAKWALALRARGLSDESIDDAFTHGRILRTHVLRPTWHFVTPADISWMLALSSDRLRRINLTYGSKLGLDERWLRRARAQIERALDGGVTLTREEIAVVLGRARIEARGQRLAHLLFDLEQHAVICSGPRRGKQFTYALFSARVPRSADISREEALGKLATHYFRSHGPATLRDFVWWSGLRTADARAAVQIARVETLPAAPTAERVSGAHWLLPNYDEYLVAYRDRDAVIDRSRSRNLGVFTSAEFPHHVILDGRVAGSWRRQITDRAVTVEVSPYRVLTRPQREALVHECERYGRFLRLPAKLHLA